MKDLKNKFLKTPDILLEQSRITAHLELAQQCQQIFNKGLDKLCGVEQCLVTGTKANGEIIQNHLNNDVASLLYDNNVHQNDKIRIILLYILARKGVPEKHLAKIMNDAQIDEDGRKIIANLAKLGCKVTLQSDDSRTTERAEVKRVERDHLFDLSRWTPVLKDVVEAAIDGSLDKTAFPYLIGGNGNGNGNGSQSSHNTSPVKQPQTSARGMGAAKSLFGNYGNFLHKFDHRSAPDTGAEATTAGAGSNGSHNNSGAASSSSSQPMRLVVFVMGGATYSEVRVGYEVSCEQQQQQKGGKRGSWAVFVGGSHITT